MADRRGSTCEQTARGLIALILAGSAVVIGVVASAGPAAAYLKPDTTTSRYECNADVSALQQQARTQAGNGRSGVNILDFGRPAYSTTSGFLTVDPCNRFVTLGQALTAVEAYADTWYANTSSTPRMNISIGTNNSCTLHSPCGPVSYVPTDLYRWGQHFGDTVAALAGYIRSKYSSQESAGGADDAEPAFDPKYSDTSNVLAGYNNRSTQPMWDYGSLEPGYWSASIELQVAYGFPDDLAFPEIYYSTQATQQWENLVLYARSVSSSMFISGVLTEQPTSGTLGYQAAYDSMMSALNSHSSTAQGSIDYSSNIS